MKIVSLADTLRLSVAERIQLAEDIWDSIAGAPEAVSLTEAQKEELDRRLEDYHKNPQAGSPWDEVKGESKPANESPSGDSSRR